VSIVQSLPAGDSRHVGVFSTRASKAVTAARYTSSSGAGAAMSDRAWGMTLATNSSALAARAVPSGALPRAFSRVELLLDDAHPGSPNPPSIANPAAEMPTRRMVRL